MAHAANGQVVHSRPNAAFKRLLRAERDGDLWARRLCGMPVWASMRLSRYFQELLADEASEQAQPPPLHERWQRASRQARRALHGPRELLDGRLAAHPYWVLTQASYRRTTAIGPVRCLFARHVEQQLSPQVLFLQIDARDTAPLDDPKVLDCQGVFRTAALTGQALGPLLARARADAGLAQAFRPTSLGAAYTQAVRDRLLYQMARLWLTRARPRCVFVVCAYSQFIPFQQAARELGVPLIELQHGVIHESHPGYVFDDAGEQSYFPDHLVVFGRHYGELLEQASPRWKGRWSVGGHPGLAHVEHGSVSPAQRDMILVVSQKDAPVRERMRDLAVSLRRAAAGGLRIVLKPHPREDDVGAFYADAVSQGVELARPDDDTYRLLTHATACVTEYSTVATEAPAFGSRSIVMRSPYWNQDIRNLVAGGALQVAESAADVMKLLATPVPGGELSQRMYGVGEPALDFEALVNTVAQRVAAEPRIGVWD